MSLFRRMKCMLIALVVVVGVCAWRLAHRQAEPLCGLVPDLNLRALVRSAPPAPIVFTSRSDDSSLRAAAPEAEGFDWPGTIPWAAREGRLRLLDAAGQVYELTWGRTLPNGNMLIDVMSPSISLDGTKVLFAGRQAPPDPGRWRIYELELRTGVIQQRTGGPDDAGCVLTPPLRYAGDRNALPDSERRRIDFDDIDPADLGGGHFAFASSRLPDLGRDHAVRAAQIWLWKAGEPLPQPLTANRNNDRWPVLTTGRLVTFSSWSRNREAVTADRSDILPIAPGNSYATSPTDNWFAAQMTPSGTHLGYAVKSQEAVWRPRPLFNGRVAFMTPAPDQPGVMRLAQADWGYIRLAPSSLAPGMSLPDVQVGARLFFGPPVDADKRTLSAGCPSPCPGNRVLFAGKNAGVGTGSFGLYSISDDWARGTEAPELLFDDPQLEDAEPVAVYARDVALAPHELDAPESPQKAPASIRLADGQTYSGPAGFLEDLSIRQPNRNNIPWADVSTPDRLHDPKLNVIPPPPNVAAVAVYASYRDRFDDPVRPRIAGAWKKLLVAETPGRDGSLFTWAPYDPTMTIVLAGLDEHGKIAQWRAQADVSAGRSFLAYAGDHYSQVRANGYHHCVGCHSGHSFTSANVRERVKLSP